MLFILFCYNVSMKRIIPYSDEKMLYNKELERYELNKTWVKNNFDIPFDDNVLEKRIKKNTRVVYNRIFEIANSANRKIINKIINCTKEYRNYIFDCLSSQIESDLISGYNDQSAFVPESKEQRDLQVLNAVSVDTERIIYNAKSYGGINLVYSGVLPSWVYLTFME